MKLVCTTRALVIAWKSVETVKTVFTDFQKKKNLFQNKNFVQKTSGFTSSYIWASPPTRRPLVTTISVSTELVGLKMAAMHQSPDATLEENLFAHSRKKHVISRTKIYVPIIRSPSGEFTFYTVEKELFRILWRENCFWELSVFDVKWRLTRNGTRYNKNDKRMYPETWPIVFRL